MNFKLKNILFVASALCLFIFNFEAYSQSNIEKTPYCIDVNPVTKDIYVGDTDYVNNGKMYCFGNDGTLKTTFNVGVNPCKTVFLMK